MMGLLPGRIPRRNVIRVTTTGALLAACMVTVACGDLDPQSAAVADVVAKDSAGVRIVENPQEPSASLAEWRVVPEAQLEIGGEDDQLQLYRVTGAIRLASGELVVANSGDSEIVVYDPSRRVVRRWGRRGRGPGEFQTLSGVVHVPPDTLLTYDQDMQRISLFDLQGNLVKTETLTGGDATALELYRIAGVTAAGDRILKPTSFSAGMKPQPMIYWDSVPLLRYRSTTGSVEPLDVFSGMDIYATPETAAPLAFGRVSSATVHDGYIYIADGGNYEVRVFHPDTGLVRIVRLRRESQPVTSADLVALQGGQTAAASAAVSGGRADVPHAPRMPAISNVIVDQQGLLWVEQYRPRYDQKGRTWLVFDVSGRLIRTAELPAGLRVTEIGDDYVVGVWRDTHGVERLRVHQLIRPTP